MNKILEEVTEIVTESTLEFFEDKIEDCLGSIAAEFSNLESIFQNIEHIVEEYCNGVAIIDFLDLPNDELELEIHRKTVKLVPNIVRKKLVSKIMDFNESILDINSNILYDLNLVAAQEERPKKVEEDKKRRTNKKQFGIF
ncbi:MAG: hypothetical protein ACTSO7_07540 [Candidatus Heimdallarchaeota archaeon]